MPVSAMAQSVLVTVVADDSVPETTWWPTRLVSVTDTTFFNQLSKYGLNAIEPAIRTDVRFSPAVYRAGKLTDNNARGLGSLFGADYVLNGSLHWTCEAGGELTHCEVRTSLNMLLTSSGQPIPFRINAVGISTSEVSARKVAVARVCSEIAGRMGTVAARPTGKSQIPAYIAKPVLVVDALPDADSLVSLRKAIKRVNGVTDVAEVWVADGSLALEINPGNPQMSLQEFETIVAELLSSPQIDHFLIRETRRTEQGFGVELVTY